MNSFLEVDESPPSERPRKGDTKVSGVAEDTDDDCSSDAALDPVPLTTVLEEDQDVDGEEGGEGGECDKQEIALPLFQYSRVFGTLPRSLQSDPSPFSVKRTCAAFAKVFLNHETTLNESSERGLNQSSHGSPAGNNVPVDLWQGEPISIAAYGFENGHVYLVDGLSGMTIAGPDQLIVREARNKPPITDLSMDSSGTFLSAIDDQGMCAVFDLRYAIQMRSTTVATSIASSNGGNVFTSLISAFTGGSHSQAATNDGESNNHEMAPFLTVASLQVQRISYPSSFGRPTCLVVDPAYRRRREKSMLVGFADGKLVMTKRGFVFQRRNDVVLYQAVKDHEPFHGVEAIAWRGALVAWADSSGVRLLDSDTLQRIAHVDRPSGARPSLYPTLSDVKPSLCFETSKQLLVAWGDCLLTLHVREIAVPERPSGIGDAPPATSQRRQVECTMAWELDCIACGIVPLDVDHVVVLGLVPPIEANGESEFETSNEVEIQVISRTTGNVVFADLLPLARTSDVDSTQDYQLLSSFAVPRMDDVSELHETSGGSFDPASLFVSNSTSKCFKDSHCLWGLDKVAVNDETLIEGGRRESSTRDTDSVDSDDYGNISRSLGAVGQQMIEDQDSCMPPVMVVCSCADAVLVRVRDADDAVSFALEEKKYALALHRGLQHLPRLRRYKISELVDHYLTALLRLELTEKPLSIRRMKMAVQAMPMLLGGDSEAWEHWIDELARIPGALFVAKDYIPVRDPKLRKDVYTRILKQMLQQVDDFSLSSQSRATEGENWFLDALLAWGTSKALQEYTRFARNEYTVHPSAKSSLEFLLESGERRKNQTAVGFLCSCSNESLGIQQQPTQSANLLTDLQDCLFDIEELHGILKSKVRLDEPLTVEKSEGLLVHGTSKNGRVVLEAMARLCMMKSCLDESLMYYLTIGALHTGVSLQILESEALESIASLAKNFRDSSKLCAASYWRYFHVIELIETYHLHRCVLDKEFLPEALDVMPIFALAKLVGLGALGDFLITHCVAPRDDSGRGQSSSPRMNINEIEEKERLSTLPLDLVAGQLETSPKLLHWYLHSVFLERPDLYVHFPTTSIPAPIITSLHRKHLNLHIKYAGEFRDSAKVLKSIEMYRVVEFSTPLLSYLKSALLLGGIGAIEVAKILEVERRGSAEISGVFALELAFIIENYGNDTIQDATLVLELYLKGAKSLMLAVAYAQRATPHSVTLWQLLLDYCLAPSGDVDSGVLDSGSLFGSLLEAAALSGADLAHLVKKIPEGMAVEGLRPRLVAAVADYRLKLQMIEYSTMVATGEKKSLLRECGHRLRKGLRFEGFEDMIDQEREKYDKKDNNRESSTKSGRSNLPMNVRPQNRPERYSSSCKLAIR